MPRRHRFNIFDVEDHDGRNEWYAAAYMADKFNERKDTSWPIYIRGTRTRDETWLQTVFLYFANKVTVQVTGLYWNTDIMRDGAWIPPFGCPLYELLTGTFKSSPGTAKAICGQPFDWIYTLAPGHRQIKIALDGNVRLTHELALHLATGK